MSITVSYLFSYSGPQYEKDPIKKDKMCPEPGLILSFFARIFHKSSNVFQCCSGLEINGGFSFSHRS